MTKYDRAPEIDNCANACPEAVFISARWCKSNGATYHSVRVQAAKGCDKIGAVIPCACGDWQVSAVECAQALGLFDLVLDSKADFLRACFVDVVEVDHKKQLHRSGRWS